MKKVFFSKLTLTVFLLSLMAIPAAFAEAETTEIGTPQFAMQKLDRSDGKKILKEIIPGESFKESLKVINVDPDRAIDIKMEISNVADTEESKDFDPSWVQYDMNTFTVPANEEAIVTATIIIPKDTEEGFYDAALQAKLDSFEGKVIDESATQIDLAVGVRLGVTVSLDATPEEAAEEEDNTASEESNFPTEYLLYIIAAIIVLIVVKMVVGRKKE